jgi:hypothetical protein
MTNSVATLILPCEDNKREPLTEVHNALKRELCELFGGFTAVPCYGGWIDEATGKYYEDRSFEYRVAMPKMECNDVVWDELAIRYGIRARLLSVYLTYPCSPQVPAFIDLSKRYGSEKLTAVLDEVLAA